MTSQPAVQLCDLSGKVAIVTGGAMGIGQGIVFRLAEAGATVMISDIDLDAANETVRQIKARSGKAQAVSADAASVSDAQKTIRATVRAFGHLDILVNNAGIFPYSLALDVTEELWDKVLNINLKGMFFYSQAAAREMINGGRGGKIINVVSTRSFHPGRGSAHYAASKGGAAMLTKSLALELAPYNILVNAVAPDAIVTPGRTKAGVQAARAAGISVEEHPELSLSRAPLGRLGEPDDIAKVVLFLASSAADYMTGAILVADAGYLLS